MLLHKGLGISEGTPNIATSRDTNKITFTVTTDAKPFEGLDSIDDHFPDEEWTQLTAVKEGMKLSLYFENVLHSEGTISGTV